MPRPKKTGLDYFPLDCDFFESKRTNALRRAHNSVGIATYLFILCKIYGGSGYYYRFDSLDDLALDIAEKITGDQVRRTATQVTESILYLVEQGMLDQRLFEQGVMTGKAIQEQYLLTATAAKRKVEMDSYNLISGDVAVGKMIGLAGSGDRIPENGVSSEETLINSEETAVNPENMPQSKVKGKVNTLSFLKRAHGVHQNVMLTEDEHGKLREMIGDGLDAYLDRFSVKLYENGYQYASHYDAICKWWEQDKNKKDRKPKDHGGSPMSSFDTDEFYQAALKRSEMEIRAANERAMNGG